MQDERHSWITRRAYQLWEDAGRIDGQDREHWMQASKEWQAGKEDNPKHADEVKSSGPEGDARGQYAPSQADRKADGVVSAKPTVISGSEDATVHRDLPGKKRQKDFDLNYDTTEKKA